MSLIIVGTEDFAKASPAVQKESLNLVDLLLDAAEKDEAAKPTNSDAAKLDEDSRCETARRDRRLHQAATVRRPSTRRWRTTASPLPA